MKPIILVTGCTRGLGLQIVNNLLGSNFKVIGIGRKKNEAVKSIKSKFKKNFYFEEFDFINTSNIKSFSSKLINKYGRFYGLINNAAVGLEGVLGTMHENDIRKLIKINIEAPIILTKYISRSMLIAQKGKVINISSIIGSTGFSGLSVYAASKAAMNGFTKSLSRELGKAGITVNAIAPGYMETDMTKGLKGQKFNKIINRSPLKKLIKPREVAKMVEFLLGADADNITGSIITIDAGSTA